MNTPSLTLDHRNLALAPDTVAQTRRMLYDEASKTIFAIEQSFPIESEVRRRYYLARVALNSANVFLANGIRFEQQAEYDKRCSALEAESP